MGKGKRKMLPYAYTSDGCSPRKGKLPSYEDAFKNGYSLSYIKGRRAEEKAARIMWKKRARHHSKELIRKLLEEKLENPEEDF